MEDHDAKAARLERQALARFSPNDPYDFEVPALPMSPVGRLAFETGAAAAKAAILERTKMSKHTPGPWKIQRHTHSDKSFMVGPVYIDYDDVDHKEQDANAKLCSAAPDLLAACKALIDAPHPDHFAVRLNDEESAAIEAIQRAIAKAE